MYLWEELSPRLSRSVSGTHEAFNTYKCILYYPYHVYTKITYFLP